MNPTTTQGLRWWIPSRLAIDPRARVLAFSLGLALIGLLGFFLLTPHMVPRPAPFSIPWPAFALFYFIAEAKVVDIRFKRGTHTFSLTEVPAVIGLFLVEPVGYVLGLMAGASVALLRARQPPVKAVFNLSQFLVGSVAALAVFHAVIGPGSSEAHLGPLDWLGAFAAMLTTSTLSAVAIAIVIPLSGGEHQWRRLPEAIQVGALFGLTNAALALLAVEILWHDTLAIWLVIVPLATLFIAYRAYLSERQKHESLELLYESSQILQRSSELDTAILTLLEHARLMFGTERAEIILSGGEGCVPLRTSATLRAGTETMVPAPDHAGILARLRADPRPFIDDGTGFESSTPGRLFRSAMVCPLRGESGVIGAMLAADRLGENDTFGPDQLRMLETVANQAAVALENSQLEQSLMELSRLKEELRHRAFHDPLTGLANRALFLQILDERLDAVAESRPPDPARRADSSREATVEWPVVLFLDLDDFKIVNDTVGHAAGDRLLRSVADRLVAAIRDDDLAARLGGDEFAVILANTPDMRQASLIADRIVASLRLPFRVEGRDLTVGASIGLAGSRAGMRAHDLLRNADVAMYAAKAQGKRQLAVWSPEMHEAVVERHTLSTELVNSVASGAIWVAYQPLVALDGRGVVGFEALARWDHPNRGPQAPELFIRMAEESGAIVTLGRSVLEEACRQAASWARRPGLGPKPGLGPMVLSVNLSPVQVHEPRFTDDVLSILADAGLDPQNLVLEMTETAMFRDIDATIGKLKTLRSHGVRIAVDDFGTGYSSLRWLRQLPVDVLKLGRDFIMDGDAPDEDWAFAHAIVKLGSTLGLTIVAEGIETTAQRERLQALGCQVGQGYLFSRAVGAEHILDVVTDLDRRYRAASKPGARSPAPVPSTAAAAGSASPFAATSLRPVGPGDHQDALSASGVD